MAIQDIILRSTTNPPLTNKGSELTYTELDTNFIEIYDYLTSMNAGGTLTPWSISTTYTGTTYVSYSGNIYKLLVASSLGEVPTSYPAVWQLTSIGELAHEVNKDTYLNKGGAYEVTAQELYGLVNEQTIVVTATDLENYANAGTLIPNRIYQIGLSSPVYYFRSISNLKYSNVGWIRVKVPDVTQIVKWSNIATYAVNFNVAYYSNVYKNLTGTNNPSITPPFDSTNWQLNTLGSLYTYELFSNCQMRIQGGTVEVNSCVDRFNNTYGKGDFINKRFAYMDGNMKNNHCMANSGLNDLSLFATGVVENNTFVNGSVFTNSIGGVLSGLLAKVRNNHFNNGIIVSSDNIMGDIINVTLINVSLSLLNGWNSSYSIKDLYVQFDYQQSINIPPNHTNNISGSVTKDGSSVVGTYDITGTGTILDLDGMSGQADIVGVWLLSMTSASETIDTIVRVCNLFPIQLRPISNATTLTINLTDVSSISTDGQVIGDVASVTLYGELDYAILEPVQLSGYNIWRLKTYTQTL